MRSSKPAKNQRISNKRVRKQQHLLEVSVRRETLTRQRNSKILSVSCTLVIMVALTAGAWIGGKELLRRFLWENPDYYLTDIRVPTDGTLTREQILTATGIVEGKNIFTIDLTKAREALDALPQVERAEIQRVLPNRITVSITERHPIAWVTQRPEEDPTTSEKAFLIDARGVVMKTTTILPEFLHLPVISGVSIENLVAGDKVKTYEMQAALELIRLSVDNERLQVRNLDLSKGYCVVVTDQMRRKITFGLDRVDLQLDRLTRLLNHLEPQHREIQTVNLVVERNVPVTFVDHTVEETPAAEPEPKTGKADPAKAKDPASGPSLNTSGTASPAAPATIRRAEAAHPSPTPASRRPAAPATRKKTPIESVKKPFKLNG